MKYQTIAIICLAGSMLFAQGANAQANRDLQFGLSKMLNFGGVANDIGISPDEAEALSAVWLETKQAIKGHVKEYKDNYLPKLSESEKDGLKAELEDGIAIAKERELAALERALSAEQIKRLKQIRFQYMKRDVSGFEVLSDRLDISDTQLEDMKKVVDSTQEAVGKLRVEFRRQELTRKEFNEEMADAQVKLRRDVLEVLTSSQRRKLRELEGEPFEFNAKRRQQKQK